MIIFGHRGAAGEAPENTIAGLQHGLSLGIRHFEIDLRISADNELVVLHDRNLERTTKTTGNVDELDSEYLASVTVCGRDGSVTTGVPTLKALLASCQPIERIQLELKSDESTNKPLLVDLLATQFPDIQSTANIVVTSFDNELLGNLKQQCPHIPIGLVAKNKSVEALHIAKSLGCDYLCLLYKLVLRWSAQDIETFADTGLHVSLWTVNDVSLLPKLQSLPVQSIITDYPSRFV